MFLLVLELKANNLICKSFLSTNYLTGNDFKRIIGDI
jgi:hypothetical protein